MVWHKNLLAKLTSVGLAPKLCKLFESFLSDRRIKVVIDGISSSSFLTNAGVPQGSVINADPALTNSLDSLAHRRSIFALSLYCRYYHGVCSVKPKSIIPPNALFTRNTRFSNSQHPFAVKLDKNRTSAFANSFIPMTSRDWNSLSATVFPATYNLQLFKTRIHRHLQRLPSP